MKQYTVSPEFKSHVTNILNKNKYSLVFPFMNLVNRDGFEYTEFELNELIQFLGEFPYNEVAEFFLLLPSMVNESGDTLDSNGIRDSAAPTQETEDKDSETNQHAMYQNDVRTEIFDHTEA